MRFANYDGRLTFITSPAGGELKNARGVDVNRASGGRLPASPSDAYAQWPEVKAWAEALPDGEERELDPQRFGAPSPRPTQIFGIGINYADHGAEAGMEKPEVPLVFTKLAPSITGPFAEIMLTTSTVDWEVELVVVIGSHARAVTAERAWDHVAGLTGGQDISDRDIQWRPKATPQFGLGKSLPGFGPTGPLLVTRDEFRDPEDIELSCRLNGEEVQHGRTSQMLFPVPELVAYLSSIVPLLPGDLIFTGTPSGVGMTRKPPRFLTTRDVLESSIEGVGDLRNTFAAEPHQTPRL